MSGAQAGQGARLSVTPPQREELARLARGYRLRMVVAFGSAVAGKTHPRSDLGVAVLPEAGADLSRVHEAARETLVDVPAYLEHVQRFLDRLQEPG